jgi:hypothetical protein
VCCADATLRFAEEGSSVPHHDRLHGFVAGGYTREQGLF